MMSKAPAAPQTSPNRTNTASRSASGRERVEAADDFDRYWLVTTALSVDEVLAVVEHFGGLVGVLHQATDAEPASLYASMGVSAGYNAERGQVRRGADPGASTVCLFRAPVARSRLASRWLHHRW
jgi:hypothetical protein